ncbi:octaprenyl-diphosphate synthase [Arboricoccus pini]|uniref:Octaprenyl diphosphate synthase n=1 Tax=Arboricoccus pini TaxID=1963835 RepID=A0A212QND2_9PROT|nr:polyprenyl synthetase family protein [Arboricoccus pini]SNB60748.1 octaprenyl-diphosphate synthase [Arboricoccus pini]
MSVTVPPLRSDQRQRADRLDGARRLVGADLERVNVLILERLQSEVSLIPELARHLIASGGKRVRPMLTLLAAKLCDYEGEAQIALATAVEFIHTATLLHDDVVDESDLRRGTSTANTIWGNKSPVLVGDFLFSRAFQLMVATDRMRVLEILANASAILAEGEVAQLVTANDLSTTEDAYLRVIEAKTASLFKAACEVGAVIADRPAVEERGLADYGTHIGIAFQLVDDALDYAASQAELGKTVGDDFREGKITLPVLLAYNAGSSEERAFWERTMERLDQSEVDLSQAQAYLSRHQGVEQTIERACQHGARAKAALDVFPSSPVRDALLDLVDFCIERAY